MYVSTDFNISLWAGNELSSRTSIVVNFCWPCCGLWVESAFAAFHVGSPRVLHYIMDRNRNWNRFRIREMGTVAIAIASSKFCLQTLATYYPCFLSFKVQFAWSSARTWYKFIDTPLNGGNFLVSGKSFNNICQHFMSQACYFEDHWKPLIKQTTRSGSLSNFLSYF